MNERTEKGCKSQAKWMKNKIINNSQISSKKGKEKGKKPKLNRQDDIYRKQLKTW